MTKTYLKTSVAQAFADTWPSDETQPDLSDYTHISTGAAEVLSHCRWALELDGLEELSSAIASLLVRSASSISLDGITELTVEVARELAAIEGTLSLNGMSRINDEVAQELSSHIGDLLLGVCQLSDAAAKSLGAVQGNLYLNGLNQMTAEVARGIGGSQHDVRLREVKQISDMAASHLAMVGGKLELCGLKELSVDAACRLAVHQGPLDLSQLCKIDSGQAEQLAKVGGELTLGISDLTVEIAKALATHGHELSLPNVVEMDFGTASSIVKHEAPLSLGLKTLDAGVAERLAQHKSRLSLWKVKEIDDATAEALASHRGTLNLSSLTRLSPLAATSLVRHSGEVELIPQRVEGVAGKILCQLPVEHRLGRNELNELDLSYLRESLLHPHKECRLMAAEQFVKRHFEAGAGVASIDLRKLIQSADGIIKVSACEALLLIEPDDTTGAADVLKRHVCDVDRDVKLRAIQAVGNVGSAASDAATSILEQVDTSDPELCHVILEASLLHCTESDMSVSKWQELSKESDDSYLAGAVEEAIELVQDKADELIAKGSRAVVAMPAILEALNRSDDRNELGERVFNKSLVKHRDFAGVALLAVLELDRSLFPILQRILRNSYARERLAFALSSSEDEGATLTRFCRRFPWGRGKQ